MSKISYGAYKINVFVWTNTDNERGGLGLEIPKKDQMSLMDRP